jgi:hypothetical protein
MVSTAKAVDLQVPVTLQPQYSLLSRENEREIVPAAVYNGIGLLPWSPSRAASSPASISAAGPPLEAPAPAPRGKASRCTFC